MDTLAQTPLDEDRLYKFKNRYLIYSIRKRPESKKVVFVFSGVDATAAFCRMSYYGVREELDATVVHVMDHFGAHGSYFLSIAGDQQIRNAIIGLVRHVQGELSLTNAETYFVGTSKGGTSALLVSLMVGGGQVIAGEPQIRLGDFIYSPKWEQLEQWRALAYAILGRVSSDDKEVLNRLISEIIERYMPTYRGRVQILYGNRTGYWSGHISHLCEQAESLGMRQAFDLIEGDFADHGEVVAPFLALLKERVPYTPAED